jgi:hypothetical protein
VLAICLTAWNRPDSLRRLLQSLARLRGLPRWKLYVQVEPSDVQEEVIDRLRCAALPCDLQIAINPVRRGVRANPAQCLARAWGDGAQVFLLLEDDLELSADALEFVEHSCCLPLWNQRYACGNLHFSTCFNHAHLQVWPEADQAFPVAAVETYFLSSLGLFFTRQQYERFVCAHWWDAPLQLRSFDGARVAGWDCALNQALLVGTQPCLQSLLPRVRHHGIEGVHSDPLLYQCSYAHAGLYNGDQPLSHVRPHTLDELNAGCPGSEGWGVLLRMASQLWSLQRSALFRQLELERCQRELKSVLGATLAATVETAHHDP